MRQFLKSGKLENVRYEVRGPVLEEANRMVASGEDVLKLNIGNPALFGFSAPDELFSDLTEYARCSQAYSDTKGILEARLAIADYCSSKGIQGVTENDVFTGNGSSEMIIMAMQALLNTGDEILIPTPDYPVWTAACNLAGGTAVYYMCDEQSGWNPDTADIRKKITPRTKAIVVINPNNPTGAHYEIGVLKEIAEIAREHELMVLSDEIYDRLVMDNEPHTSLAALAPDLFCVTFNGLSKSHTICGYRCGWVVFSGNKSAASDYIEGVNILASMRLCSNVPSQQVVARSLQNRSVNPHIMPGGRLYEQGEFIYKAMNDIPGVTAEKPKAAMYIFPKLDIKRFNITNDQQFAYDLLRKQRVLIVQGTGFSWPEPDHFRIVFLPEIEVLGEAADRIRAFLKDYRQA